MQTIGYAAFDPKSPLRPWEFTRRDVGENDVLIEILYAGVCHTDIHVVRNEWGTTKYPMVPGHEIVGKVIKVGPNVNNYKVGDHVAVGCLVDSCRTCPPCKNHQEQFCEEGPTFTYDRGYEKDGKPPAYGGYSRHIVVNKDFVFQLSDKFTDLKAVAPLMVAGLTVYSPLSRWKTHVAPGKKVAINGLGGLGHMGVKFAASFGAEVTVLSTSLNKEQDAKKLGAHHFVVSKDPAAMEKIRSSFDLILDTVSAQHDLEPLLDSLQPSGVLALVGGVPQPFHLKAMSLISGDKILSGSLLGGVKETQEMLDYCAKHGIVADIELISFDQVNEAYDRMLKSDVKYRFVIDVSTLAKPA
jgi:uncharacterized zinc-type alcohol dehydrogenase-like protein